MIAVNVPSGLMTVFTGATCYSFPDWAMLRVKGVDYVYVGTIGFGSLSDHTWLYFPCRFFCCLECHANGILPSLPSSVRADFVTRQMKRTGWAFVVSLQFSCEWPQLLTWCSSPVRILNVMYMLQGKLRFHEMIHGGSCLRAFDLSTNFGLPLFEAWAYQLKKIFVRHTRVCGLIMPGQGEFYFMVFHWRSVKPTFDVSGRYSRADVGMTFTVSASLPMMRPTL